MHGRHGECHPQPLQPVVRLRHGYGHRRHRLRLGHRPVERRGTGLGAARGQIPPRREAHRLVAGHRPPPAEDLLHHQPRHHPAHVLHRGGLHLLHRIIGPAGQPGAAGRERPAARALHALLLHERRLRLCGRGAHGTLHRRPRRNVAAPLPARLPGVGYIGIGPVRRDLHHLVARSGGALRQRHGRKRRGNHRDGRPLHHLDHPDPDRQRHAVHHGRHHGRGHRDARHAQLDVPGHADLLRHLLRAASRDRQQRPLAGLHALHVPARRAAVLHDATPEDHPREGLLPPPRRIGSAHRHIPAHSIPAHLITPRHAATHLIPCGRTPAAKPGPSASPDRNTPRPSAPAETRPARRPRRIKNRAPGSSEELPGAQ